MNEPNIDEGIFVGRRRCRIPEHRKQIASLQKQIEHFRTAHTAMYHRMVAAETKVELLTLQLRMKEIEK